MDNIIGIGGSIHDFATCLHTNNKFLAIEDERITRVRYGINYDSPCQPSLQYCLNAENLHMDDITRIIANDDVERFIPQSLHKKLELINHHLAHIYSAFFTSHFDKSAILVVDGAGSKRNPKSASEIRETTTLAYGEKNTIKILDRTYGDLSGENPITKSQTIMTNSLGELYRIIAENIGLSWLSGPGKMMGLSSYGAKNNDDRFVSDIMQCVELLPKGKFFIQSNGKNGLIDKLHFLRCKYIQHNDPFEIDAAFAYSGQIALELILFHILNHLATQVSTKNLCLVGGVALNSIANGKIIKNTPFKNIHIIFAPGDNGTAIGATLWGLVNDQLKHCANTPIRFPLSPYLGKKYDAQIILNCLKNYRVPYKKPNNLNKLVAERLADSKVVAWFQNGSEFGPRALGNRCILADPSSPKIRDRINHAIKKREWFRPLAPVVLDSEIDQYFDSQLYSPWMQFVWPVKNNYRSIIPSVTHIDGSARVQSISFQENNAFASLLQTFQEIKNLPVLLNTSFNVQGPIVETPEQAVKTFLDSEIDALAIGEFFVEKS